MESERPTGQSVLIRNLNYGTTVDAVREAFEKFGDIKDIYLPRDFKTKRPRGFGFVEYASETSAEEAIKAMDNVEFGGSMITCCLAQDRRKSPESMRRAYRSIFAMKRHYDMKDEDPREDYYGRPRSRSRSPGGRYPRHSYAYDRRPSPGRDYYYRREHARSPHRYGRPYDYDHDYRDNRDTRRDYVDRGSRRYEDRAYHDDYSRPVHDRRHSPLRSREERFMPRVTADTHDARVRNGPSHRLP